MIKVIKNNKNKLKIKMSITEIDLEINKYIEKREAINKKIKALRDKKRRIK